MSTALGYSTYPLKKVDPFEALPKLRDIGYEALEICMSRGWPTSPEIFDIAKQRALAKLSKELGFPSPIIFGNIDVCSPIEMRDAMIDETLSKFRMAQELHYDDTPILITTTAGHNAPAWDSGKEEMRDAFMRLADLASENDIVIAIEAHAGTDFETPEKAVWMIEQTTHPNLKLDLDISHFYVEGADVDHSVDICAEHSVMVHVKDGTKIDGSVQYCLPGAGSIDLDGFIRALKRNELDHLPVYAEVSVQQSGHPDYNPEAVAKFCYKVLDEGRLSLD